MTGEIKETGSTVNSAEPGINAADSGYEVKLKISRSARSKLPENFNIHEIGSIDLKEAEAIANEDILFLTENDLIEGLEDFDLIPLNDEVKHVPIQDAEIKTSKINTSLKPESVKESKNIKNENQVSNTDHFDENINNESIAENKISEKDDLPDLFDFVSSEVKNEKNSEENLVSKNDFDNIPEVPKQGKNDLVDAAVDMDNINPSFKILASNDLIDENEDSSDLEPSMSGAASTNIKILSRKDEVELIDDFDSKLLKSSDNVFPDETYLDIAPAKEIEKEKLPDWIYTLESSSVNTYFIDDESVERDKPSIILNFEERELEKITSRIIETFEVTPKILLEADIEDDKENIAYTASGIAPAFDDLLLDFEDDELKYKDDDLEFIHSSIIEEDYSKYLRLIDEYHGLSGDRKVTAAVELLGLTNDELDDMNDALFAADYKGINLDEIFSQIRNQSALKYSGAGRNLSCTYLLTDPDSLLIEEKKSIEEDLSSEFALIYEEDVEQLKSHLKEIFVESKQDSVKVVEEIYDITDRVVILEDKDDMKRFVEKIPEHKRDDLVRLMKYLDGMFEKLPENTVKNFADSEYFNLYVKILNDLGV